MRRFLVFGYDGDGNRVARDYEETLDDDEGDWELILNQPEYVNVEYVEVWELSLYKEFSFD